MNETTDITTNKTLSKKGPFHFIKSTSYTIILIIFLFLSLMLNLLQYRIIRIKSTENNTLQENFSNLQTELDKTNADLDQVKKANNKDSKNSLLRRCGDIPYDLPTEKNSHWTMVSGPEWSQDCRYIAWGKWESGTSWLGEVSEEELQQIEKYNKSPKEHEGIYLYNDGTKKIIKIYTPSESNKTPEFTEWRDSKTVIFRVDGQLYKSIDVDTLEINDIPAQ